MATCGTPTSTPPELQEPGEDEPINGLRRIADCDGDGRPDLVVQTQEQIVCEGSCGDTSPRTIRTRAYVIPARDIRPGSIVLGSAKAGIAGERDEEEG